MADLGVKQVFPRLKHPIEVLRGVKRTERRAPRHFSAAKPAPVFTPQEVSKLGPVERIRLSRTGRVIEFEKLTDEQKQVREEAGLTEDK